MIPIGNEPCVHFNTSPFSQLEIPWEHATETPMENAAETSTMISEVFISGVQQFAPTHNEYQLVCYNDTMNDNHDNYNNDNHIILLIIRKPIVIVIVLVI